MKGLLVLDGEGKRIVARYYSSHFASSTEELAFEKRLFDKTARTNAKTEGESLPRSPTPAVRPFTWRTAKRPCSFRSGNHHSGRAHHRLQE